MKIRRMARLLSIALVLMMLWTDFGSRFINYGGLNKVYAEEQGKVYIDYLTKAKEMGFSEMTIGVDKDNENALNLYRKYGFTEGLFDGADEAGEYFKLMKRI